MRYRSILLILLLSLTGCQSAYYSAMEKVGYHKREIMVDRVEDAQESQRKAQQTFQSAFQQITNLTQFKGGELEDLYEQIDAQYKDSKEAVDDVQKRITNIENVADALFSEWHDELSLYTNQSLRFQSEQKLKQTRRSYRTMLTAMKTSEKRMIPVLNALRDNSLYLKHNLNANAITSLQGEFSRLRSDIQRAITQMNDAIDESDEFIHQLNSK